ncbi:MAG: hypothetical protein KAR19_15370 [Bacteroidales bacterium]|nr:hypothetical protein [Bacteroidales bacterium]
MYLVLRIKGLLMLLMLVPALVAQDVEGIRMVKYTHEFEFRNGIFANLEMVKANRPISPARIITDLDIFDRDFYKKVTANKEIVIYDDNGVKKLMKTKDVWGYGRIGELYINVGNKFHRIYYLGSISRFIASETTYTPESYGYDYFSKYFHSNNIITAKHKEYLYDFESNEVREYNTETVGELLKSDPELYAEYNDLRKRQKKKMKLVFIHRYNEKHPLYFPAN